MIMIMTTTTNMIIIVNIIIIVIIIIYIINTTFTIIKINISISIIIIIIIIIIISRLALLYPVKVVNESGSVSPFCWRWPCISCWWLMLFLRRQTKFNTRNILHVELRGDICGTDSHNYRAMVSSMLFTEKVEELLQGKIKLRLIGRPYASWGHQILFSTDTVQTYM